MSSRSEKAMFKAEAALEKAEAELSIANTEERAAWKIVWSFEKAWNEENPDKKGYWFDDRNYRKAEKMAMTKTGTMYELKGKTIQAKEFF